MRTPVAILMLLFLPSGALAGNIKGICHIALSGTSTLHDFSGTVTSQPFTVSFEGNGQGKKIIPRVEVLVPVDKIDTKNRKRDKQMRKMFQSDTFPFIRGVMLNLDPDEIRYDMADNEKGEGALDLTLVIRHIEHTIQVKIGNLRVYSGKITFDMEFPVSLKAYRLKPPAPLFGLIRVGDAVSVKASFDLETDPGLLFHRTPALWEGTAHAGMAAPH